MQRLRIGLAWWLLATTGCAATFQNGAALGAEKTSWSHFFVLGWIGHAELDARDVCESARFARVRTGANGLTVGATILTLGIYAPRRTLYVCEGAAK